MQASQNERRTRTSLSKDLDQNTEGKNTITLDSITIQQYRWSAIFTVTHWLDSHGRENAEKVLIEEGWECLYLHRKLQFFLSVCVDDLKMAGTTRNMPKARATSQKKVDLNDPVSFTDQVHLGCTQRAAQVNNIHVMDKQKLFSKLTIASADVKTEEKKSQRHRSLELRHGRSCSKVC